MGFTSAGFLHACDAAAGAAVQQAQALLQRADRGHVRVQPGPVAAAHLGRTAVWYSSMVWSRMLRLRARSRAACGRVGRRLAGQRIAEHPGEQRRRIVLGHDDLPGPLKYTPSRSTPFR